MSEFLNKIKIYNYDEEIQEKQVVCLGFFDCIHLGHIRLIQTARMISFKKHAELSVFTFLNNPFKLFSDKKEVLTFEERCIKLKEQFVNNIIAANFDKKFANLSPKEFLDNLFRNKNITAVVVGNDYTFGKNAKGNIEFLRAYLSEKEVDLFIIDMYMVGKQKLSSTYIRQLVEEGNVRKISHYLDGPYIISGKVVKGRGVGSKINIPTANIEYNEEKIKLKPGVYATNVVIDGVTMKAVTNVGTKPTFNDNSFNIESHIIYFKGELYNKNIIIEFIKRIRDIKQFNSEKELVEQITKDISLTLEVDDD